MNHSGGRCGEFVPGIGRMSKCPCSKLPFAIYPKVDRFRPRGFGYPDPMFEPFDTFRTSDENQPIWVESAPTLEHARQRVEKVAAMQPGEYLIVCHTTGEKIPVRAGRGSDGQT
jgi:hypothetical protein